MRFLNCNLELAEKILLTITLILVMMGPVMVYSTTFEKGFTFLKWQLLRVLLGLLALFLGSRIRYDRLQGRRINNLILLIALVLMVLTIFVGKEVAGAKRWILFIQPQEIMKLALVIWLCRFFANSEERSFSKFVLPPLIVTGLSVFLILQQPAVSAGIILTGTCLVIYLCCETKVKHILTISLAGIAGFLVITKVFPNRFLYIYPRIKEFITGEQYQTQQALVALGSGGLIGKGLGGSMQKYNFLPEIETDFIFAAIGEELGFVRASMVIILYMAFFLSGIKIACSAQDNFGNYLGIGIVTMLFLYSVVHIGVNVGLFPATGQPLPFISYGGSALLTNLFSVGLLLSISRYSRRNYENFTWLWRNRRPYISGVSRR